MRNRSVNDYAGAGGTAPHRQGQSGNKAKAHLIQSELNGSPRDSWRPHLRIKDVKKGDVAQEWHSLLACIGLHTFLDGDMDTFTHTYHIQ